MITETKDGVVVNLAAQPAVVECPPRLYRGVLVALALSVPMWVALIWAALGV